MSCYRSLRPRRNRAVEINMAPLIDMIFILLIFFIVTTSFVRESGIEVQRPSAETAQQEQSPSLQIGISEEGVVYVEGRAVDVRSVRNRVAAFLADTPDGAVLVVADRASRTDGLIRVVDQCRLAGARNIGIAARRPQ
ncbi:MAG: biopolymer transporter ExbD [Desulfovibrionaceae bacterium]